MVTIGIDEPSLSFNEGISVGILAMAAECVLNDLEGGTTRCCRNGRCLQGSQCRSRSLDDDILEKGKDRMDKKCLDAVARLSACSCCPCRRYPMT